MFQSFFGLDRDPFSLNPDPSFLYPNRGTRDALAGLVHGILNRKGFVVLTGESGTGKSTLLRAALLQIPREQLCSSLVFNPTMTPDDLLEFAMADFGIEDIAPTKSRRVLQLQQFLFANYQAGQISLLMIDEAHLLTPAVLEEVRLLTNFETAECKLLQVVLAGHSDLDSTLDLAELRQLKQRIAVRIGLRPLSSGEVAAYIKSRWVKAGGGPNHPFTTEAINEIGAASKGIPRLVNSICDNALITAYGSDERQVTAAMIEDVRRELRLDQITPPRTAASASQTAPGVGAGGGRINPLFGPATATPASRALPDVELDLPPLAFSSSTVIDLEPLESDKPRERWNKP